jgi:tryptophan-rich sensory protein
MSRLVRLGVSLLLCFGAGLLGSIFVSDQAAAWYDALQKPFFMPPNGLFPVVWTVLYILMGLALWLVWEKDDDASEVRGWVPLFIAHLLVNASWTIFFFGYHATFIALIDIVVLLACIILLMIGACQIDKRAGWLLAPYLLWVCFATILNGAIWWLN